MPSNFRRRLDRAAALASSPVPRPVRYFVRRVTADGTAEPPEAEHAARVAAQTDGFHVVTWRVVRVNDLGSTCPARVSEGEIR